MKRMLLTVFFTSICVLMFAREKTTIESIQKLQYKHELSYYITNALKYSPTLLKNRNYDNAGTRILKMMPSLGYNPYQKDIYLNFDVSKIVYQIQGMIKDRDKWKFDRDSLINEITTLYFKVEAEAKKVKIIEDRVMTMQSKLDESKKQYKKGAISKQELMDIRLSISKERENIEVEKSVLRLLILKLSYLSGLEIRY